MIFEKWWKNCFLVGGLWFANFILKIYLDSLNPSKWLYNGPPPEIMTSLPWFIIGGIAIYLSLYLFKATYTSIGPKLVKSWKNVGKYGLKSTATLAIILGEVVSILGTLKDFNNAVFHVGNRFIPFQEFMIDGGFTIFGIYLIYNLRNIKIEFQQNGSLSK